LDVSNSVIFFHYLPAKLHDNMDEAKVAQSRVDSESAHYEGATEKGGTSDDTRDMIRMGKMQETRRNFHRITILGFCMVILSTWEAILSTSVFALANGGTAVRLSRDTNASKESHSTSGTYLGISDRHDRVRVCCRVPC
jgi:hypothetical protein